MPPALNPALGFDLSRIRIHADAAAADSAERLQAQAYTVGDHVVFGPNQYRPHSHAGRLLLAHELAHVAQHKNSPAIPNPANPDSASLDPARPKLQLGTLSHPAEREAEAFAQAAVSGHPNLLPRIAQSDGADRVLRRTPKAAAKDPESWAGVFKTMQYEPTPVVQQQGEIACGAKIRIAFKPNKKVDADQIAFSQTAQITVANQPASIYFRDQHYADLVNPDPLAGPELRGIASENVDTSLTATNRSGKGEKAKNVELSRKIDAVASDGAGTGIDNLPKNRAPLANMTEPPKGAGLSNPELKGGIVGSHSREKGAPKDQDAEMYDTPQFNFPKNADVENTFESTALAVSGAQKGAYYGSVRWGWQKKATDDQPTLLPFTLGEKSTPSPVFAEAVNLWNASSDTAGEPSIPLPVVGKKYVTGKDPATLQLFDKPATGKKALQLTSNIQVEMTDETDAAHKDWKHIIVVEGPSTGKTGWIKQDALSDRPALKK